MLTTWRLVCVCVRGGAPLPAMAKAQLATLTGGGNTDAIEKIKRISITALILSEKITYTGLFYNYCKRLASSSTRYLRNKHCFLLLTVFVARKIINCIFHHFKCLPTNAQKKIVYKSCTKQTNCLNNSSGTSRKKLHSVSKQIRTKISFSRPGTKSTLGQIQRLVLKISKNSSFRTSEGDQNRLHYLLKRSHRNNFHFFVENVYEKPCILHYNVFAKTLVQIKHLRLTAVVIYSNRMFWWQFPN